MGNRIERTTAAVAPAPAVPWWKELAKNPWARRVGVFMVGAALGAACKLLPPAAQPICDAAAKAWHLANAVPGDF